MEQVCQIGSGAFGCVHKCINTNDGSFFATKQIHLGRSHPSKAAEQECKVRRRCFCVRCTLLHLLQAGSLHRIVVVLLLQHFFLPPLFRIYCATRMGLAAFVKSTPAPPPKEAASQDMSADHPSVRCSSPVWIWLL